MEKQLPQFTPYLASDAFDVDGNPGWASRVKFASPREVRVGADLSIEARLQPADQWQPIMLPHGGTRFVSREDAELVVRMIRGEEQIPSVVTVKP